ncbi:MAG: hypothetical protein Q9187_003090 [Circinaria calcarea]
MERGTRKEHNEPPVAATLTVGAVVLSKSDHRRSTLKLHRRIRPGLEASQLDWRSARPHLRAIAPISKACTPSTYRTRLRGDNDDRNAALMRFTFSDELASHTLSVGVPGWYSTISPSREQHLISAPSLSESPFGRKGQNVLPPRWDRRCKTVIRRMAIYTYYYCTIDSSIRETRSRNLQPAIVRPEHLTAGILALAGDFQIGHMCVPGGI